MPKPEKDFVVSRIEHDDGTWNAQPEYLRLAPPYGAFEWLPHAAHASKMTFLDAVMLSALCRLGADEYADTDKNYSFSVADAYRS